MADGSGALTPPDDLIDVPQPQQSTPAASASEESRQPPSDLISPTFAQGTTITFDPGDGSGLRTAPVLKRSDSDAGYVYQGSGGNQAFVGDKFVKSISAPEEPKPKVHGVPANAAAGFNEAAADLAGAPVDAASWLIRQGLIPKGDTEFERRYPELAKWLRPDTYKNPVGGSESIKHAMGLVSANPEDVQAGTEGERVARGAGRGATAVLFPAGEAGAAVNALAGTVGGAAGEEASEHAAPKWKPLVDLIGNLVGAGGVAGGAAAAGSATNLVRSAIQRLFEPADVTAARRLLASSADPEALKASLETGSPGTIRPNAEGEGEANIVGARPTVGQASGDLGVLGLERGLETANTAPFAANRGAQNAARLDFMRGMADPEADPAFVSTYVKNRLAEIEREHAQQVASASDAAARHLEGIGGESFDNGAAYTEELRGNMARLDQQKAAAENQLWRAIDPDREQLVNIQPFKRGVKAVQDSISGLAKKPAGEEAAIYSDLADYPNTTSVGELTDLWGRVAGAIREERKAGGGQPLRRLAMIQEHLADTLAGHAQDAAAIERPVADQPSLIDRLAGERDAWLQGKAGRNAGEGTGTDAATGPADVSATSREGGQGAGRLGVSEGAEGVPGSEPVEEGEGAAPLSEDWQGRYREARAATAERKQKFSRGPVGQALKSGADKGSYVLGTSQVGRKLFETPEGFNAYLKAAGTDEDAIAALRDYAANSLRKAAVSSGYMNPQKYQKWMADHSYVFTKFPELRDKFGTAASAQEELDGALARQKEALSDYQTSAARHVLNNEDPVKAVGLAMKRPEDMEQLAKLTQGNPDARNGLKRAAIESILRRTLSTSESAASGEKTLLNGKFNSLLAENRLALSKLFSEDELRQMEGVGRDLERSNRSVTGVKIPGSSDTAPNLAQAIKATGKMSYAQYLLLEIAGAAGGALAGLPVFGSVAGAVVGAAAGKSFADRQAARQEAAVKELVNLVLDPARAKAAIEKIPMDRPSYVGAMFRSRMRALLGNEIARESTGAQ